MQAPIVVHFKAVQRLLMYLKATTDQGLLYSSHSTPQLTAYYVDFSGIYLVVGISLGLKLAFDISELLDCTLLFI